MDRRSAIVVRFGWTVIELPLYNARTGLPLAASLLVQLLLLLALLLPTHGAHGRSSRTPSLSESETVFLLTPYTIIVG